MGVTTVVIPDTVLQDGQPYPVTAIGNAAFQGCISLASITLPSAVRTIGNTAFQGCTALKSFNFPSSLTSLGVSAFAGCTSLASATLPSSLTTITDGAFQGCTSLASLNMPAQLTAINASAFFGCSKISLVTLPSTVTSIGNEAFANCAALSIFTLLSATPPVLGSGAFSAISANTIFNCPPASLTSYRENPVWSPYFPTPPTSLIPTVVSEEREGTLYDLRGRLIYRGPIADIPAGLPSATYILRTSTSTRKLRF
jgi:hypothetical protein